MFITVFSSRARLIEFCIVAGLPCSTADLLAQLYRIECVMVDIRMTMSNLALCTYPWNMHSPRTQHAQPAVFDPCGLSQPQYSGNHVKPSTPSKSKLRRQRVASKHKRLRTSSSLTKQKAKEMQQPRFGLLAYEDWDLWLFLGRPELAHISQACSTKAALVASSTPLFCLAPIAPISAASAQQAILQSFSSQRWTTACNG